MSQDHAICLPAHLRRCLVDKVTGILSLKGPDADAVVTIAVDAGVVVRIQLSPDSDTSAPTDVRSLLEPLFSLADMPASFEARSSVDHASSTLPLADVLLDGIKSVADTSRVSKWLGRREDVLERVSNPYERFSESTLGPTEGYFLSRIEQPMSIQSMLDDAAIDPDLALRIVCGMRYAGVLTAVDESRPWIGTRGSFDSQDSPEIDSPSYDGTGSDELAQAFHLVEEKLRSVQSGADHYAVLEVERRASIDRIKASYRELAKTFHPDRHALLARFDADIKSRLEVIFTAVTTAYSTLSNAKDRDAYDTKLHKTDQASAFKAPVASPSVPKPKPPPPPPPPVPEPQVVAPPKPVKGPIKPPMPIPVVAPLPRRPKPPPASEKPKAAAPPPPKAQPEGWKDVTDDVTPPKPVVPVPARKPTVEPDALYDHGTAYAESGDWERAVQALKRGIDAAPEDARMHAKLGAALASLHGLNKLAEASLRKSLELDSNSAERYVEVAEVYLKFDRPDDAKTLFKRAFLIDSENVEARIALGKMGVPGLSREAQPGFFKRLFRKS